MTWSSKARVRGAASMRPWARIATCSHILCATIARDPFELSDGTSNPVVAHPSAIFKGRRNAKGWDITDPVEIARIETGRAEFAQKQWQAGIAGFSTPRSILNPSDPSDTVGAVHEAARVKQARHCSMR